MASIIGWAIGAAVMTAQIILICVHWRVQVPWAAAISIAVQAIAAALSFRQLGRAVFDALASARPDVEGIERRLRGVTRHIPWSEVWAVEPAPRVRVNIGGRWLVLGPADRVDADRVRRLWRAGLRGCGQRRLPLLDISFFRVCARLWISYVLLLAGALMMLPGARPPIGPGLIMASAATIMAGFAVLATALERMVRQVVLTRSGLRHRTLRGWREMPWEAVDLLSTRLEMSERPFFGRAVATSVDQTLRLTTREDEFRRVARHLMVASAEAFILDDNTGRLFPPKGGDAFTIRDRFGRHARRAARRYRFLAVMQILGLPLLWIAWLLSVLGGALYIDCMPYRVGHIRANFRKAAEALASWRAYEMDPSKPSRRD